MFLIILLIIAGIICTVFLIGALDTNSPLGIIIICLVLMILCFWKSHHLVYKKYLGQPTIPDYLDKKMIYEVAGQLKNSENENFILLESAAGNILCIKVPFSLPDDVSFVRKVKTGGNWGVQPIYGSTPPSKESSPERAKE